jgi:hypothetical protein
MGVRTFAACLVLAASAWVLTCAGRTTPDPTSAAAPTPMPALAATPVPGEPKATPAPAAPAPAAQTVDLFATTVRPVLQNRCSPCHEPGGKMYDRLPFDRPETLAANREKALQRLKGDDRAAFEAWLKTLP